MYAKCKCLFQSICPDYRLPSFDLLLHNCLLFEASRLLKCTITIIAFIPLDNISMVTQMVNGHQTGEKSSRFEQQDAPWQAPLYHDINGYKGRYRETNRSPRLLADGMGTRNKDQRLTDSKSLLAINHCA